MCERRTFVRNPHKIQLNDENLPVERKLVLNKHPLNEIKGYREWDLGNLEIFIEEKDIDNEQIRLKDFADIKIKDSKGIIQSIERTDKRQIVHWLPKTIAKKAVLTIPKGNEIIVQEGMMEDIQIMENNIVQLERVGYARIESSNEEVIKLLWLHG
jgi:glutamyl/glutaminyl-tRNA synthetase